MNFNYLGSCEKALEHFKIDFRPSCCTSCHDDDDDFGIELSTVEIDCGYFEVCCSVKQFIQNNTKVV